MTPTISGAEYSFHKKYNVQPGKYNLILDDDEVLIEQPESLGQYGYTRSLELLPGIQLDILDWRSDRDLICKVPRCNRCSIEIVILNSGYFPGTDFYPTIGGKQAYFSGSGIVPVNPLQFVRGQHFVGVVIYLEPKKLSSFFPDLDRDSAFGKQIIKQDDWVKCFFPTVTPAIGLAVQQIIDVPYRGATRKLYLQAKVLELLAIQLDRIMTECKCVPVKSGLKPQTIDRIYQAREILATNIENPPSILKLAQLAEVSERTLRSGFRELFNTTIIGYLTSLRMEKAKRLLREKELSVSEIANLVGYSNPSHFSAAFKRQFGITPSQCMAGKKIL